MDQRLVGLVKSEPPRWDRFNRALQGAYIKAARARKDGEGRESCPYRDVRKWDGRLTWSRAFETAWLEGHTDASKEQSDERRSE